MLPKLLGLLQTQCEHRLHCSRQCGVCVATTIVCVHPGARMAWKVMPPGSVGHRDGDAAKAHALGISLSKSTCKDHTDSRLQSGGGFGARLGS